jgi:alanyl-tRNA synthetase
MSWDLGITYFVLATAKEGKPMLSCYISKELVVDRKLNAGQVVRELGVYPRRREANHFATAGGKNTAGIQQALIKD